MDSRNSSELANSVRVKVVGTNPGEKTTSLFTESAEEYSVLALGEMLNQRPIKSNLLIMALVWLCSTIDYILLLLSLSVGGTYEKATVSAITDIIGIALSLLIYSKFGIKGSLCVSLCTAFLAGCVMIIDAFGILNLGPWPLVAATLIAKLGIVGSICISYLSHFSIFPTLYVAATLGYSNFLAHAFTTSTPLLYGVSSEAAAIVVTITAGASCLALLGLKP